MAPSSGVLAAARRQPTGQILRERSRSGVIAFLILGLVEACGGIRTPSISRCFDKAVPLWDHGVALNARCQPQGDSDLLRRASAGSYSMDHWYRLAKRATWSSFADGKQSFNVANFVAPHVVFDIGGNKYRHIAEMNFARRVLFTRRIMTHKEYMRGAWKS
jgi:mRNA interferase HigB